MRTYKYAIYITCAITLISFCIAFALNFYFTDTNPFWCNLLLGIFGSSSLTLLTSIVGYRVERRRTFEGFSYATKAILHDLNKYQYTWGLEEKVDFFLNYTDISKIIMEILTSSQAFSAKIMIDVTFTPKYIIQSCKLIMQSVITSGIFDGFEIVPEKTTLRLRSLFVKSNLT